MLPSWRDKKQFGSMIRAALWLETEVGEGQVFTKTLLREAFPDVAQIDRRLRDLRDRGWQIDTAREDPSLKLEEQRYVKRGAPVWIPGNSKAKPKATLTVAQRTKVLVGDNFLCRSCGIAAGEPYGDDGVSSAQLDIARRKVVLPDGTVDMQLVTECNRCRVGGRNREVDIAELIGNIEALGSLEKDVFSGWVKADRRRLNRLEELWGHYRALPAASRALVAQTVAGNGE
jgi:hypothetical protein